MADGAMGSLGVAWARLVEDVVTGMRDWRTAHPTATFAELEVAVEARLGVLRARMLEEAALLDAAADDGDAPACAVCGAALEVRATAGRSVRIQGEQQVRLVRPYLTCTACGRGRFPPG